MSKIEHEKIINWMKEHPLISSTGLEITLLLPDGTIRHAIAGRRSIPIKHLKAIVNELKKYGYKN